MGYVSRAGRKEQIKLIVYRHWKRNGGKGIKLGNIARRLGMKSSTELKKICRELSHECESICIDETLPSFGLCWHNFTQTELPQRYIAINGNPYPVAKWVADKREYEGNRV